MSDPCYWTARRQADAIRRREISATELVTAHLEQIERVNTAINAIVSLDPDLALNGARQADNMTVSSGRLGALHGLPIAHKDTIDVAGWRTTHGSPIFTNNVPERSQLVVQRTQAAGAITIGKTNVPELGAGSHTCNPIFGVTRNPYDTTRSAGGSSGGAAAALASGMIPIADGSDTGGSLRNPAAFNNVVGLRPSAGRVPNWPETAAWGQLSVKGPLARNVGDLRLLLSVMAGPDSRSPISIHGTEPVDPADIDTGVKPGGDHTVSDLRVAWAPTLGGLPLEPDVARTLSRTVSALPDLLGCTVEQDCPDLTGADEAFLTWRAWQMELALGSLLDKHPDQICDDVRWNIEVGRNLTGPDVGRAERLRTTLFHRMRQFFDRYDLLLAPTTQVVPFPVELNYPTTIDGHQMTTYLDWMKSCYLVSVTGCPALSIPGGFTDSGLPVGLQVIAPFGQEHRLFGLAEAIERVFDFGTRRPAVVDKHVLLEK